jgi:hypothetical protein
VRNKELEWFRRHSAGHDPRENSPRDILFGDLMPWGDLEAYVGVTACFWPWCEIDRQQVSASASGCQVAIAREGR